MNITEFMTENSIEITNLSSKDDFFNRITDIALREKIISDKDEVIEGLKEREQKGSTGLLDGFAIPHAQTSSIKKAAVIIVKSIDTVEWETLDNQPVDTAICLLVPKYLAGTLHIDFLSEISKLLMDEDFRAELNQIQTSKDMFNLLTKQF